MATQAERITALEQGIGQILTMLQGTQDTASPATSTRKGRTKKTTADGRTATFKLSTLAALGQTATVGGTFTYVNKKGVSGTWHVLAITDGVVTAQKVS